MTRSGKQDQERAPPPPPTQDQAKRVNRLEVAREALHAAVNGYRGLLRDKTLSSNRTEKDRDAQMNVFVSLNKGAGDLETENAGEGLLVLAITALNSVILLKDELNIVRYDQAMLYKKFLALEATVKTAPVEVAQPVVDTNS